MPANDDANRTGFSTLRFIGVFVLTIGLVSLLGRCISDFDEPADDDPHDLIRGLGVWLVGLLVATLNEMRIRRRKRDAVARNVIAVPRCK